MALQWTEEEQLIIDEVYSSSDPGRYIHPALIISGDDFTGISSEISSGREGDEEPGQVLTAKIGLPMASSSKGYNTLLNLLIENPSRDASELRFAVARRFTGNILTARYRAGFTDIMAVTGAHWNDKVNLRERVDYEDIAPSEMIYDAVLRNQAYDHSYTQIEVIEVPKLTRTVNEQGDYGFSSIDKVGDVLEAASEKADIFHSVNFFNGHQARPDYGPARISSYVTEYFVGPDIDPEEIEWSPTEEEYWGVLFYREIETNSGAQDIDIIAEVEIIDSVAPVGVYYEVSVDENTSDEEAWQQAFDVTDRIKNGFFKLSFPLSYPDVRIEDGDAVLVHMPDIDGDNVVIRTFSSEIRTQQMGFTDQASATHEINADAVILIEEIVEAPVVEPEEPSRITVPPIQDSPFGYALISDELPFVTDQGDYIEIDTDMAFDLFGLTIEEFSDYIEVPF